MKKNIRYAVKITYPENPGAGEWEVVERRKEKEGQNQKELDKKSLPNIAIFWEYFLVRH